LQIHIRVHPSSKIEGGAASSPGIVTVTGAGRLPAAKARKISAWRLSDLCPVPSHFLRFFARFPFTSFAIAVAAITSKKKANSSAQPHSDSESDAERAEGALFDSILRVINQIFRRAAALFDSAFCSYYAVVDRVSDCCLHAFDLGSYLIANFYCLFAYLGLHCYSLLVLLIQHWK
jgi:hypothetical protein